MGLYLRGRDDRTTYVAASPIYLSISFLIVGISRQGQCGEHESRQTTPAKDIQAVKGGGRIVNSDANAFDLPSPMQYYI